MLFEHEGGKETFSHESQFFHEEVELFFFKHGVPHLATCIFFLFFNNEPELGIGIDPGMALTPLPSSIGWGLNPRPSDREPSALPLDHGFRQDVELLRRQISLICKKSYKIFLSQKNIEQTKV